MATTPSPGPPNLEHRHLRSALELAIRVAESDRRRKPPLPVPTALKPLLHQPRLPGSALGRVRRVVDADADFRARVAEAATPDTVDAIGMAWLHRADGWQDRIAELVDEAAAVAAHDDAALALKRSERRREAAEQLAARARNDVAALTHRIASQEAAVRSARDVAEEAARELRAVREELAEARQAARHAADRVDAAQRRAAAAEAERDGAVGMLRRVEQQRDDLLAARAERAGAPVGAARLGELRALADSARALADRLTALVDVRPPRRVPVAVPGAVGGEPRRAAEFVLRLPGVLVLVDGYNVAKLTWPDAVLADQREHLLDAVDAVVRRFGAELVVVFDGADVPGAHARRRRLARVRYSPAGVSADDVIRREVADADPARPVLVVTNDAAVRRDVAAAGANLTASEVFADLALGERGRAAAAPA